jgi:O-antigen/teichoic acid export membrane protein
MHAPGSTTSPWARGHRLLDRIRKSPYGSRIARGAFWSLVGAVVSRALNLVASIFIARVLTKDAYGAVGVIQGTVGLFGTLAGFGLGTAVTKYVSEHRRDDPGKAGRVVALALGVSIATGGVVSLALGAFAHSLAGSVLAAPQLVYEFQISALLVFLGSINGVQVGALNGLEAFRSIAAVNLVAGLTGAPVQLLGAWLDGLPGAVWGLVVSAAVNLAIAQVVLVREARRAGVRLSWRGSWLEAEMLGGFAVPLVLVSLMTSGAYWVCNAFMVNQRQGYAEMGVLNVTSQWLGMITFVAASLQQGVFPALSESLGRKDASTSRKILRTVLMTSMTAATPITIAGIAASPWIMALYGKSFAGGWPVLAIVMFTAWLQCLHIALNQFILAAGRIGWFSAANGLWAVLSVVLAYLLVRWGAQGLAASRALAFLCLVVFEGVLTAFYLRVLSTTSVHHGS